MTIRNRNLALALAIAVSLAGAPALAAEGTSAVNNARMESQIWTTYALSPYLRANDLKVTVADGTATLTGTVEDDVNKDLAEQIALGVEGVDEVDNNIAVQADYQPMSGTEFHRYGSKVDDASTSAAIRAKLSWSQRDARGPSEVSIVDGKVTLKGEAASTQDKQSLTRLALNTHGVRSVDNQMVVVDGAAESDKGASTVAKTLADSWITAKVKSTFMYSSNVDSSDITVSTQGGVVTLDGRLGSGAEHALAIEFAQNVRGVKRVDSSKLTFATQDDVASAARR
ncbi:MAG TPA: BON domain-containing protein [Arenimonas sp.]|nr:BON domain-containing protein [Arenimonas sp.]